MVRRSAPALLGLFVCLLAAHLSSAAPAFRLDESRIRLSLDGRQARVRIEVENNTGREFPARLRVELLEPDDRVYTTTSADVRLHRGTNALDVAVELAYEELLKSEREEFPWYRLRYSVAPVSTADAPPALAGVVSVSEVTPDLFEQGASIRRATDAFFKRVDLSPDLALESNDTYFIKLMVEHGLGVSVMPSWAVREEVEAGRLAWLRVAGHRLTRDVALIALGRFQPSPTRAFIEYILEHREGLQEAARPF